METLEFILQLCSKWGKGDGVLWRNSSLSGRGGDERRRSSCRWVFCKEPGFSWSPLRSELRWVLTATKSFWPGDNGWISEGPQLPFKVGRRLFQEPRRPRPGCKLPASEKVWVAKRAPVASSASSCTSTCTCLSELRLKPSLILELKGAVRSVKGRWGERAAKAKEPS